MILSACHLPIAHQLAPVQSLINFLSEPPIKEKGERGEYDRIALYKNKKAMEPIVVLEKDQFTPYVFDDAQVDEINH